MPGHAVCHHAILQDGTKLFSYGATTSSSLRDHNDRYPLQHLLWHSFSLSLFSLPEGICMREFKQPTMGPHHRTVIFYQFSILSESWACIHSMCFQANGARTQTLVGHVGSSILCVTNNHCAMGPALHSFFMFSCQMGIKWNLVVWTPQLLKKCLVIKRETSSSNLSPCTLLSQLLSQSVIGHVSGESLSLSPFS